ncbi:hypothetical protein VYU27_008565, partial [Nannochloropsis oceanica]
IREEIQRDMEREKLRAEAGEVAMEDEEAMEEVTEAEILPRHFEDAVRNARRSVSDRDLQQYSSFAQNLQQARSQITGPGGSLAAFSFPSGGEGAAAGGGAGAAAEEEDDLYS